MILADTLFFLVLGRTRVGLSASVCFSDADKSVIVSDAGKAEADAALPFESFSKVSASAAAGNGLKVGSSINWSEDVERSFKKLKAQFNF